MPPDLDVRALLSQVGDWPLPGRVDVWRFVVDDRRGWVWFEDVRGDTVVHLSLLVADRRREVQDRLEVVERLPAPAVCEFDAEDEYIGSVVRFRLAKHPQSLRSYCAASSVSRAS